MKWPPGGGANAHPIDIRKARMYRLCAGCGTSIGAAGNKQRCGPCSALRHEQQNRETNRRRKARQRAAALGKI